VLFNGGSLHPRPLRQRICREIGKWQGRPPPIVLENPEPDFAVARGAARFGKIVHSRAERIEAGNAHSWNAIHRLGYVVPPSGGITLPDSAIKAPDTAFISHGCWNALTPADRTRAFTRVAPDVTFELLSPRDDFDETVAKIIEYLVNGTHVGVLLNPRDRTVGVARSPKNWRISTDPDALEIGDEMPGFILNARAVFDACEGKG